MVTPTAMLGIAVGVAVLIVVLSVVNGFETELRERLLSMTSHATISGYTDELRNWQDLRGIALRHDEVVGAAPYVEAEAMLLANGEMSGALLSGIDPELEQTVSGVHEKMTTGELGSLRPGAYNIVLGKALAEALDVIGARPRGWRVLLVSKFLIQASITFRRFLRIFGLATLW